MNCLFVWLGSLRVVLSLFFFFSERGGSGEGEGKRERSEVCIMIDGSLFFFVLFVGWRFESHHTYYLYTTTT